MLGAIIGDIVGSRFEFVEDDNRSKNFACLRQIVDQQTIVL